HPDEQGDGDVQPEPDDERQPGARAACRPCRRTTRTVELGAACARAGHPPLQRVDLGHERLAREWTIAILHIIPRAFEVHARGGLHGASSARSSTAACKATSSAVSARL